MKFSIIIPAFNPEKSDIARCVHSAQQHADAEILLINDCSTNWFKDAGYINGIPTLRTSKQGGPGAARNVGLDHATGDWVIFLDSDDELAPDALDQLSAFIADNPEVDAIGYGWVRGQYGASQRKDGELLNGSKRDLLLEYLKLRMDGSVIYTAVKRSLIEKHGLRFRDGLHEDIDFIFNVYRLAARTAYLSKVLYYKTDRAGAITRTITQAHIAGFFAGWNTIGNSFDPVLWGDPAMREAFAVGTIGVIATRVREVYYKATSKQLIETLHKMIPDIWQNIIQRSGLNTQYAQIAKQFVTEGCVDPSLFQKKWSCNDLQHSLFLAPDEVRTCCKRFFKDGDMCGDVVLVGGSDIDADTILRAKHALFDAINKGEETPCSGCPFMEFKIWPEINSIQYLSMEHHTMCNMKCTYCDEKYYGRQQPQYDVLALLKGLPLGGLRTVVWGGGEPTLGKHFKKLPQWLMVNTTAHHRFLTNATVHSTAIETVLRSGRGEVTVSIDAGTPETFAAVRGTRLGLRRVLSNLRNYARINASVVTIKYILTEDNCIPADLVGFADYVIAFKLQSCNFQISCDFKDDKVFDGALAVTLKRMLHGAGCPVVFFDDLLMQRIVKHPRSKLDVEYAEGYPKGIVIFGEGAMTEWMLTNTAFLRTVKIVARNQYVPGVPVLVTGSQGYPVAYRRALAAGVPEELIIQGVVL